MIPITLLPRLACLAALVCVPPSRSAAQDDPDRAVSGGETLPPGWSGQTDWTSRSGGAPPMSRVKFVATNGGYHATMGPAAIFWRDADTASGAYRVEATITQLENPKHAESYGLLVGGHDLAGAGQTYEYFLVRAYDGKFSIRRRAGRESKPSALVEWTAHEAVATADRGTGRATNRLAIETGGGRVRFFVNDVMIHEASGKALHTNGIVGYRVNHNLDVQLSPIEIRRMVRP